MSEQEFALGEFRGHDFGVEEAGHVGDHSVVNGLFITVLKRGVGLLVEGARATSEGRIRSAVLDLALEELALFEQERRILTGAHRNIEHGHDAQADKTSLPVFGLFEDAGNIAAENGSRISVHGR